MPIYGSDAGVSQLLGNIDLTGSDPSDLKITSLFISGKIDEEALILKRSLTPYYDTDAFSLEDKIILSSIVNSRVAFFVATILTIRPEMPEADIPSPSASQYQGLFEQGESLYRRVIPNIEKRAPPEIMLNGYKFKFQRLSIKGGR